MQRACEKYYLILYSGSSHSTLRRLQAEHEKERNVRTYDSHASMSNNKTTALILLLIETYTHGSDDA